MTSSERDDHVLRLFVYGTLRPGEAAFQRLLAAAPGARILGPARTEPTYTLVNLGAYPAMVAVGSTSVVGDLIAVPSTAIGPLDDYEGPLYRRVPVALDDGSTALAYVAEVGSVAGSPVIRTGDWRQR